MPDWIHRIDIDLLFSVAEADLPQPAANYIEDPDLTAVEGVEQKYWKIEGDDVLEMTQAEKDAVDEALYQEQLKVEQDEAKSRAAVSIEIRSTFQVMQLELQKLFTRVQQLQDALNDIKLTTGGSDNIRAAIPNPNVDSAPAGDDFLRNQYKLRSGLLQDYVDDINSGNSDPVKPSEIPAAEGKKNGKR